MAKNTIDRRWLPLNALRAFEGVARHGSFTAAANALLISQSALSRHVIALERLLGVPLFERKPHALALTKAGQYLLPAVARSLDRLEYALDDIRNDGAPMQRTLRAQMPPSFAAQLAVPILRDFRRISTEVDIDLISPSGVGLPLGDVDVAVVCSKQTVTDLVTDLLWQVRLSLLCHPSVAARHRGKGSGRLHRGERDHARAHRRSAVSPLVGALAQGRPRSAQLRARPGLRHRRARRAVLDHPSRRAERHRHRAVSLLADREVRQHHGGGEPCRAPCGVQ